MMMKLLHQLTSPPPFVWSDQLLLKVKLIRSGDLFDPSGESRQKPAGEILQVFLQFGLDASALNVKAPLQVGPAHFFPRHITRSSSFLSPGEEPGTPERSSL